MGRHVSNMLFAVLARDSEPVSHDVDFHRLPHGDLGEVQAVEAVQDTLQTRLDLGSLLLVTLHLSGDLGQLLLLLLQPLHDVVVLVAHAFVLIHELVHFLFQKLQAFYADRLGDIKHRCTIEMRRKSVKQRQGGKHLSSQGEREERTSGRISLVPSSEETRSVASTRLQQGIDKGGGIEGCERGQGFAEADVTDWDTELAANRQDGTTLCGAV
jgi:hypothetical protein